MTFNVLSLVLLVLTPRHRLPVINRLRLRILATEPEKTIREIVVSTLGFPDLYEEMTFRNPHSLGIFTGSH
jgi:hypothetical protein